jgi:hypothetical protein
MARIVSGRVSGRWSKAQNTKNWQFMHFTVSINSVKVAMERIDLNIKVMPESVVENFEVHEYAEERRIKLWTKMPVGPAVAAGSK